MRNRRTNNRRSDYIVRKYGIPDRPNIQTSRVYEGYLLEDLSAAGETKTDPTTAKAMLLKRNRSGDLQECYSVTITNRSTSLTVEAYTYIQWVRINQENRVQWADCEADVSSSSSSC